MTSGSMADAASVLIVHQVGDCDRVTGAVMYQASVDEGGGSPALSFTRPRDGVVTDLGFGMFRYTVAVECVLVTHSCGVPLRGLGSGFTAHSRRLRGSVLRGLARPAASADLARRLQRGRWNC